MTYKEISTMIESIGLPFAYYQFPDSTPQTLPFICFIYDYDDVHADNSNYVGRVVLNIELYTENKDFDMENTVETVLREHGMSWAKESTYIDSEKMQMTNYSMGVIING